MKKVVLGLSGGVDSAVSAYLLKEAGYDVVGVHITMIPEKYGISFRAAEDAKKIAEQIGIAFETLDLREDFEREIIQDFTERYFRGQTPSPCIVCNRKIKFGLLWDYAKTLGAEYIATGHYAKISNQEGRYFLQKGEDLTKDQSYFLYGIPEKLLQHIIFPLSQYQKEEIRQIAEKLQLTVAQKPDSQEICFVPNNDYKAFLHQYKGKGTPGDFVDTAGRKLGAHNGIEQYTIGQRKGLGIALGKPAYVVQINAESGQVVLGDNADLFRSKLLAEECNFLQDVAIGEAIAVQAKIRYRALPADAVLVRTSEEKAEIVFAQPQRAITPGQGVCIYLNNTVLGGGTIVSAQ